MEASYQTLLTIYEIVKSDPSPHTYLCTPQEIILRQTQDWSSIEKQLAFLAAENLVTIKHLDKMVVTINTAGIAKARALKNNFVNNNFSFHKEETPAITSTNPLP